MTASFALFSACPFAHSTSLSNPTPLFISSSWSSSPLHGSFYFLSYFTVLLLAPYQLLLLTPVTLMHSFRRHRHGLFFLFLFAPLLFHLLTFSLCFSQAPSPFGAENSFRRALGEPIDAAASRRVASHLDRRRCSVQCLAICVLRGVPRME